MYRLTLNSPPYAGFFGIGCRTGSPIPISTVDLLTKCDDPDGDATTISAVFTSTANGGSVSLEETEILFTPPSDFEGIDTFSYTVTDSEGDSAEGVVTVLVTDSNGNGSAVASPLLVEQGSVMIRYNGIPAVLYSIEACEDLGQQNWQKIGESTADEQGLFEIIDEDAGSYRHRFYRTRWP